MKTNVLFLLCTGMLFGACEVNSIDCGCEGPKSMVQSYIRQFMSSDTLKIRPAIGGFDVDENTRIIQLNTGKEPVGVSSVSEHINFYLYLEPFHVNNGGVFLYNCAENLNYPSDDCMEVTNKYNAQVKEIGDTSFNREIALNLNNLADATLGKIASVSITGDKDFSAAYPAGSSLNDLFTIYFNDPIAVIKNNYQQVEGTYRYHEEFYVNPTYPFAIYKEKLSAVNFPERPFIDYRWVVVLDVAPQTTGLYTFYVTVTLEDGKALVATTAFNIAGATE
ncbi:MAG: hypothetical protein LBI89_02000 [Prevotellaceae bacterium]|jgi:hypothetical protein|nr:hypothetical protein [Prevotellaceae bacterium]